MYWPSGIARPGELIISAWSQQSLGVEFAMMAVLPSTAAVWPAAGLVIYVPFVVPEPMLVTKLWYSPGVASGNIDLAINDESGNILVSAGTTAAAGSATVTPIDVTDTVIQRGRYYMAMVADTGATLTINRAAPAAGILQSFGLLQQASVTLPLSTGASPATFAKYTQAYVPLFGLQGYRTIGP